MTPEDIELLELAALAVGINGFYAKNFDDWHEEGIIYTDENDCNYSWNPLLSEVDAFRLACDLGLSIVPYPVYNEKQRHSVVVKQRRQSDIVRVSNPTEVAELYQDMNDKYSKYDAHRRAIVRAAAEIGKEILSKKEK